MVAFEQNSNRLFVFGGFNLYGEPLAKLEFLDMSAKHMAWVRVTHTQLMGRACGNICMLSKKIHQLIPKLVTFYLVRIRSTFEGDDLFVVGGTRSNDDTECSANLGARFDV